MLKRAINIMPDSIRKMIDSRGLAAAFDSRPDYQKNDYIGWILRARRSEPVIKESPKCWMNWPAPACI